MTDVVHPVALLTGADSDVGRRIAIKLAKYNHRIALLGTSKSKLAEILEELRSSSSRESARFLAIDTEELPAGGANKRALLESSKIVRDKVLEHFGRLDVLINNASYLGIGCSLLDDQFYEDFNNIIQANIKSAIHLTNQVKTDLLQSGGCVLNIACCSAEPERASQNFGYSIAKAGLSMLTKVLANALSADQSGVMVRFVGIEFEETKSNRTHQHDSSSDRVADEVAELVKFLISDNAKFVHGSVLTINGR